MDGLTLLAEARAAGLTVMAEGARLRIRGPKRAEPIARRLIAHKEDVLTVLTEDPGPLGLRPVADSSLRGWDIEARELIAFFRRARSRLPRTPFRLTRWQYISDPAKWYQSLELDISFGPLGVRARMGALQVDLRRLREYVFSKEDRISFHRVQALVGGCGFRSLADVQPSRVEAWLAEERRAGRLSIITSNYYLRDANPFSAGSRMTAGPCITRCTLSNR